MNIIIKNCNNIISGRITIKENTLNIKYGVNGTGKSSVAKAIKCAADRDPIGLMTLTPFQNIEANDNSLLPQVDGMPDDIKIAVFNEDYVSQYVFVENELVKNSFDIFIKTEKYEENSKAIQDILSSANKMFEAESDLENIFNDLTEFVKAFGKNAKTGIAASGALSKGLSRGNVIRNIPKELEGYSDYLRNEKNATWLKWQATGREFLDISSMCPFCARDITDQKEKVNKLNSEYDSKTVEHLANILNIFERFGHYCSEDTNRKVREITKCVNGLSGEQKHYLVTIKDEASTILDKLESLKNMGFWSLKSVDKIADEIKKNKIDINYFSHLNSEYTIDAISSVNNVIDELLSKVGWLQGEIRRQEKSIKDTIEKYRNEINSFLDNAGYQYAVSIDETEDKSYKLVLKPKSTKSTLSKIKTHLSYGERNAFALVLFMYQALHMKANLIVLDDPISSFDQNKKFAILDMLFVHSNSLRGKTVIMLTHDFEPIIDSIYNHSSYFQNMPQAAFLENVNGELRETTIEKQDILSAVQVATENIEKATNGISKSIFLRRYLQIIDDKSEAWDVLSSLLHKRITPTRISGEDLTEEEIASANEVITKYIKDFDYSELHNMACVDQNLISLYDAAQSRYEKLQIYRMIFGAKKEEHVVRKFINETYHIENDYLFQLNPTKYNTIPKYIIDECDRSISKIRK